VASDRCNPRGSSPIQCNHSSPRSQTDALGRDRWTETSPIVRRPQQWKGETEQPAELLLARSVSRLRVRGCGVEGDAEGADRRTGRRKQRRGGRGEIRPSSGEMENWRMTSNRLWGMIPPSITVTPPSVAAVALIGGCAWKRPTDGDELNRGGSSSSGGGEIEQPTEGLLDLARARGCEAEGDAEGAVK
jgi:hypothetical protein